MGLISRLMKLSHRIGNPARVESIEEELLLCSKFKKLWSRHPHFVFVPHDKSFIKKVNSELGESAKIVALYHKD